MKKSIQCLICTFIGILLIPGIAQTEPMQVYDQATMETLQDNATVHGMPLQVLRQHAVLWDTTHGTYLNYYPFTRYSTLTSMLIDSGYTIDVCATGVHTVDLSQYDIVLVTVMSSWNSAYGQEEIDSLVSFYNQGRQRVILTGDANFCEDNYIPNADNVQFSYNIFDWLGANGGIYIMGDNAGCNNVNINPVANTFYMTAGVTSISPNDLYFTDFAVHPVFDNVSQIYYRAGGSIAASSPAEAIAWTSAMEPVIGLLDESVGVGEEQGVAANMLTIQVDPNPFSQHTVISGIPDNAVIHVYDACGRLINRVTGPVFGAQLQQGVYFLKLEGYAPEKVIKLD